MRAVAQAQMGGHAAGGIPVINEHVGERLKMYWPEEGGWFEAIISDYNAVTDEHCLTYHINTPEETFEWVHLKARPASAARRASASARSSTSSVPVFCFVLRAVALTLRARHVAPCVGCSGPEGG